jgi:predicted transcriptional regulator
MRHFAVHDRLWQNRSNLGAQAMSTVKEELTRLIQGQPEDSSREEIVRELAFHVMVERGLADSDAKRTISNEEMAHRIRTWQR